MAPRTYATAVQARRRAGRGPAARPRGRRGRPRPAARPDRRACCSPAAPTSTPRATAPSPHPETHGHLARARRVRAGAAARAIERDMPRSGSAAGCRCSTSPAAGPSTSTFPTLVGNERHREVAGTFSDHEVRARARARSPAGRRAPSGSAVKSHHHQGVDELGDGLRGHRPLGRRRPDRGDRAARAAASRSASSGTLRRTSNRA